MADSSIKQLQRAMGLPAEQSRQVRRALARFQAVDHDVPEKLKKNRLRKIYRAMKRGKTKGI